MRLVPALLLLAGCAASPAPSMWGALHQTVTVSGRSYTVYHTSTAFEVVRHGYAPPGTHRQIRATMLGLVPRLTHCRITRAEGDSGDIHGTLAC